jgi:hypothetical protein
MQRCEKQVLNQGGNSCLIWKIDSKPLVISNASQDRQAGYGQAVGARAKGYKLHLILGANRTIPDWRVAPMNKDERVLAERMLSQTSLTGYLLADGNFDTTTLHRYCDGQEALQMISPRRSNYVGTKPDRRKSPRGRLRSIELLEGPGVFGRSLLKQRLAIEQYYGRLSSCGGGLTHLPPWARGHRRVHRWVQAKLMLLAFRPLAA